MRWIERAWYQPRLHPLLIPLLPLNWLFVVVAGLRRLAFALRLKKMYRAPVPVVVVGNISVGGTGKTPVVCALIQHLQKQGWQPGILSRGYGGAGPFPLDVASHPEPALCGDEPVMLQRRTGVPVVVAPDRSQAAQHILSLHPEINILVTDDGLQHYGLHRDLELVIVDGSRGVGNGWRLPIGPLREPASRLLMAPFVLVNGDITPAQTKRLPAHAVPFRIHPASWHRVQDGQKIEAPDGESVTAIAGIGNPERFFNTLLDQNIELAETASFADHHAYSAADFKRFDYHKPLLMTEKDAAKCRSFAQRTWYYLTVDAVIPDHFWQQFDVQLGHLQHDA